MSSTNRTNARNSHISDYYVTPIKDIDAFLSELDKVVDVNKHRLILDPAAGGFVSDTGQIKDYMSYPTALYNHYGSDIKVETVDIRNNSLAAYKADYLKLKISVQPDIIITNPPFALALEFIQKALEDVADDGYVIMLLRLNFLESKQRKTFFDKYMPKYIFVYHNRLSFTNKGTDSVAYCHMVWHKQDYPQFAQIKIV